MVFDGCRLVCDSWCIHDAVITSSSKCGFGLHDWMALDIEIPHTVVLPLEVHRADRRNINASMSRVSW
jgi:hypothetical protein